MLQELLDCKGLDDLTAVGFKLASRDGINLLQRDILEARLIFDSGAYWSKDQLNIFSDVELIAKTLKEPMADRTLHMLQILMNCCPAAVLNISRLLKRTTS